MTTETISLSSMVPRVEEQEIEAGGYQDTGQAGEAAAVALPAADGGKDAWLFLAACFTIEALVWGFPYAFGVFQSHYASHEPFAGSKNIPVIGTCAMGIMYLTPPLVIGTLRQFPHLGVWSTITGLLIMCLALGLSSLSNNVPSLIATQGVCYAIGGSIAYCPCILYLDEWFVHRKGLAYGIMWSGTGLAGVILPLLLQHLLETTGFRTTLRIWSGVLFAMTAPLAYFVRPRLPLASATHARPWNLKFLLTRLFVLHQLANITEAMGYFLPAIYLPTFANQALGASSFLSALSVLLFNVASVFGCVAMGSMTDRLHVTTCILVSTVGATLSVLCLWGFSSSLPVLYSFSVVYGLFAGSFTSTYPGIMKQVTDQERRRGGVDPVMVFGYLAAGRGVGNIVSGPISEALVRGHQWRGKAASGYGSGYGGLIVFTGITALLGGASYLWRRIGWLKD